MKKENRIKKNHEIASIVNSRIKVASKNYIIYYQKSTFNELRVAFSVSKKLGHAFERNKSKRIARNIFRKYLGVINNLNLIVVIKTNSKNEKFEILEQEADFLINLIIKRTNKENKK